MSRYIYLVFFLCLLCVSLTAQETYFFKLSRTVDSAKKSNTNVSGGQFITFIDNICYESDKKGMGVGHGSLTLNKSYSSSSFSVYMGKSYWGDKASFKFNSEKSVLNVILDDGTVYVYKRSTPPANVTTCSLIKGKTSSGGAPPANNPVPAYTPHPPINNGSGSVPSKTLKTKEIRYQEDCPVCKGKKTIVQNTYPATFGTNLPDVWCSECGRYFSADIGHTHRQCNHCRGTGKVEKVRYENVYE